MSLEAMSWVLNARIPKDGAFRTLMALANHADQWGECWPSVSLLLHYRQCSRSTLYADLAWLEREGFIARSTGLKRASGGGALKGKSQVLYRLLMPEVLPQAPVEERTPRPNRFVAEPSGADESPSGDQCPDSRTLVEPVEGVEGESPSGEQCPDSRTLVECSPSSRTAPVRVLGLPYKEEPSVEPPDLTPQPPTGRAAGSSAGVGDGSDRAGGVPDDDERKPGDVAGAPSPGASAEDWALVRSCLPEEMQALDAPSVARVAGLLRPRVDAGWSHRALRETLSGNALPPQVRSLAGLVCHRLEQIPVDQAPVDQLARWREEAKRRRQAEEEARGSGRGGRPAWMRARRAAIDAGRPEGRNSFAWWWEHREEFADWDDAAGGER